MVQITESFSLNAGLPLDARLTTTTVTSLLAIPTYKLYDGIMVYVDETKKYYSYNKNRNMIIGKNKGKMYTYGDTVKVEVIAASKDTSQVDFVLSEE